MINEGGRLLVVQQVAFGEVVLEPSVGLVEEDARRRSG